MSRLADLKISIKVPKELVRQIDNLAQESLASRSQIIRLALRAYVRQPQNKLIADPHSEAVAKAYDYIKDDHPYLDPNDSELIMFFSDLKAKGKL